MSASPFPLPTAMTSAGLGRGQEGVESQGRGGGSTEVGWGTGDLWVD